MSCKLYNKGTCRHDKQSEHVEEGVNIIVVTVMRSQDVGSNTLEVSALG